MLYRVLMCSLLCFSLVGCTPQANPGTWDQSKVEAHLKEKHKLEGVALLRGSDGDFTGSGRTKFGETFRFRVKQNAELKQLSWEYNSDRGATGSEVYEIVSVK